MNASAHVRVTILAAAVAALGTLGFASASLASTAANIGADPIAISLTDHGIVTDVEQPQGGLYVVTIRNDTNAPRGIVLKGLDRGGSRYTRFTKVLGPGAEEQLRWYFPSDKEVSLRDLLVCKHAHMTCWVAAYGEMSASIVFGPTGSRAAESAAGPMAR